MRLVTALVLCLALAAVLGLGRTEAQAQSGAEGRWLQVEALPTLSEAQARARDYAAQFDNVAGFRLNSGWYALALGPFDADLARAELVALRRAGLIPPDSFVALPNAYSGQFWPVGTDALAAAPRSAPVDDMVTDAPQPLAAAPQEPEPPEYVPDETAAEARRSERQLLPEERRDLQRALQWFGFYNAGIDGAFGRGTRSAMAEWQAAQGYDVTGVLTSGQRAELLAAWQAPFDALGLRVVRNREAGVELLMPMDRVAYARTEAPFVQYDSAGDSGMRVLLISQAGDEATLFGLYDIMQTLEIVPEDGPRARQRRSFTLRGTSPDLSSYTYAQLSNGAVKGFTLVWRDGEPRVMEEVIERMRDSFAVTPAVLPDTARDGDASAPRIDLLSGLEIRRPARVRTGFFVDGLGAVLTASEAVAGCARVTLGEDIAAAVAAADPDRGLALLRPEERLSPLSVAAFRSGQPRLRAEVAVAGYAYGDVLSMPLLTYGTLADARGLDGEEDVSRLDLTAQPGDAGGPVFDSSGAVLGILREGRQDGPRRLPEGVAFAVDVPAIAEFLGEAGLAPRAAEPRDPIPPEALADLAADLAVRVSCWE